MESGRHGAERAIPTLRALIRAAHPDLAGRPIRIPPQGWDCLAFDVGDEAILKLPRDRGAERRLAREARVLAALRPRVRLAVPDLAFLDDPLPHTRHAKIPGEVLPPPAYAALDPRARDGLAEDLAGLLADLHAIPPGEMAEAGAGPVEAWLSPGEIARRTAPLLGDGLRARVGAWLAAWEAAGPDPLGEVFGHFDAQGCNLAFDAGAGRLNGLFGFGGSGLGPVHREFVAPALLGDDVVRRLVPRYERASGRRLDRRRVALLDGVHRLAGLAREAENPVAAGPLAADVAAWFAHPDPLARFEGAP